MFKTLLGIHELKVKLEFLAKLAEHHSKKFEKLEAEILEISDNLNHLISKVDSLKQGDKDGKRKPGPKPKS